MSQPEPAAAQLAGQAAEALRRLALDEGAKAAVLADPALRAIARRVAARSIAGDTPADARAVIAAADTRGHAASVDDMGESTRDLASARDAARVFERTAALLAEQRLDCSLSLDLSHLGLLVDRRLCLESVSSLATAAAAFGSEVILSAEGPDRTDAILECHARLCEQHDNVGIRNQARLHRSERDLAALLARPGRICLLKGSYAEPPAVAIAREDPALAGVFAGYADALIASGHPCSIATHDRVLQERAVAALRADRRLPAAAPGERTIEFETLQGLGDAGLDALRECRPGNPRLRRLRRGVVPLRLQPHGRGGGRAHRPGGRRRQRGVHEGALERFGHVEPGIVRRQPKRRLHMGISTSLVLIAAGAILKWAVSATTSGVNLHTVGVVLMVVGAVGLVLSLIFWSSWGGFGRGTQTTTVVRDEPTTFR